MLLLDDCFGKDKYNKFWSTKTYREEKEETIKPKKKKISIIRIMKIKQIKKAKENKLWNKAESSQWESVKCSTTYAAMQLHFSRRTYKL